MTIISICSLYLLISTSSRVYYVTSLFLIPFTLKILHYLSIGFVLILSFFTSCLLISVWVHLESTSIYSCNFFLFCILMFVCMFNSLFLLFLWFGIIYQFWELLFTEVLYIIPTLDLHQNPPVCSSSYFPFFPGCCSSLFFILFCNFWKYALLCHTCNIF